MHILDEALLDGHTCRAKQVQYTNAPNHTEFQFHTDLKVAIKSCASMTSCNLDTDIKTLEVRNEWATSSECKGINRVI